MPPAVTCGRSGAVAASAWFGAWEGPADDVAARSEDLAGARADSLFLQSLADGDFTPVDLTSADFARMADLVNRYESLPLGTTDASVVAVAERLGLTDVATLTAVTSPWSDRGT